MTVAPIQNVASSPCSPQNLAAGNFFFSVTGNNKQFIMCDQNGNAQILTCPGQLVWDQSRQSCVIQPGTVPSPGSLGPGYSVNSGKILSQLNDEDKDRTNQTLLNSLPNDKMLNLSKL